jgi:hypothetical protein
MCMCVCTCVCLSVCVCVCALHDVHSCTVRHSPVHNDWSPRDHRSHRSDRVPQMIILVACPWLIRVFHVQMRCRSFGDADFCLVWPTLQLWPRGSVHTCIIDSPTCDSHGTCFNVIAQLRNVLALWMVFPWCTTPRSTQLLSRRHVVIALLNSH